MAWQNSAAMAGNGGVSSGSSETGGSNGQPHGTEYTLQGVMRFLQTEWHRHERDRNAWQIERAEMKSRIGKLEGDGRTSKRLQESLGKHVKILENALKKEREKVKTLQSGQPSEEKKDEAGSPRQGAKASIKPELTKPRNSFLDTELEGPRSGGLKQQDSERDKSRLYLGKCVQEVTYHVVPTAANQQYVEEQEQLLQNHHYTNSQQPQQPSLEEVYVQQRQKQQQSSLGVLGPSPLPNHQPPAVPRISDVPPNSRVSQQPEQASFMSRSFSERQHQHQHQNPPLTAIDTRQSPHAGYNFPSNEDQIESVSHSYDAYGRSIQTREDEENQRISEEPEATDSDGWNFDDPPEAAPSEERQQQEYVPPQRPDTDAFPSANSMGMKSPTRGGLGSHRRKSSLSRRRQSDGSHELRELSTSQSTGSVKGEIGPFKVRFALRGHLDVVRSIIFTGGGSPSEPEICTSGDDGVIKRWIIPASYGNYGAQGGAASSNDLDVQSYFTHRGHTGAVMSLAASPASQGISNGGRAMGDGWVFSGGQDATVRVWERGRVDPKATLDGHTDAVWTVCVLPGSSASVLGDQCANHGGPDRVMLASGAADGTILIWAVSTPPQLSSPHTNSRRGPGGSRRANSVSSGSNFPSSPQPSTATTRPFHYSLVHRIERADHPSPTCISPLSANGDTFVVSFADASVLVYGTRTGEELVGMASLETYDGTPATGVNAVAATTVGLEGTLSIDSGRGVTEDEALVHGPTGSSSGVEGMVLSGHEDRYIRFFDANSGQCTYNMLAHPSAISSLSLSPSGAELVSGGHDASLRFWSLEKRACTQEITSLRIMRGEGVCSVVWSADGRWVVGAGGEGVVKVFGRVVLLSPSHVLLHVDVGLGIIDEADSEESLPHIHSTDVPEQCSLTVDIEPAAINTTYDMIQTTDVEMASRLKATVQDRQVGSIKMLSFAIALVLLLLPSSLAAETVLGVYVFSRHGDRTAKVTPPANLTDFGYSQVFTSGAYFRNRYIASDASSRIAGINSDIVKQSQITASAPLDTVLMNSAMGFLQGLYPPVGPTLASDKLRNGTVVQSPLNGYQLIPLQTVTSGTGSEDSAWLQGASNCAQATVSSNEYFTTSDYNDLLASSGDLYKSLSPLISGTFKPNDISYKNAYSIFDLLNVASIHNTSLPESPLFTNDTLSQLRTLADHHEFNLAYNASAPIRAIAGSTLAAQIIQALNNTIITAGKSKITVQFGAYASFQSFFGLANLTTLPNTNDSFYGIPDYASTMTFELFTTAASASPFPAPDDIKVRFLFHNGTTSESSTPTVYPLFGQSGTELSWTDFQTGMNKFAVGSQEQWCRACGNSTGVCANAVSSAPPTTGSSSAKSSSNGVSKTVAGVIGAMVTLAVILAVEAAVMLSAGLRLVRKNQLIGDDVNGSVDGQAHGGKA
ncbi:MAG: hypothetical protein Q9218_002017 [Villophora microphyllina]